MSASWLACCGPRSMAREHRRALGEIAAEEVRRRAGSRKSALWTLAEGMIGRSKGAPLMDAGSGDDWVRLFPHLLEVRMLKGRGQDPRLAAAGPNAVERRGAWGEPAVH